MAAKNRGLGRGIEALIPSSDKQKKVDYNIYPLKDIFANPNQPRQHFVDESIKELAATIKSVGIIQPLVLRRDGERYMLISGERRFRAAKLAGLKEVPGVIKEVDDSSTLYMAFIENTQREDLNPIEIAKGIEMLMETDSATQEQVAEKIGMSRSNVANHLRFLKLPAEVQSLVIDGVIGASHAKAIMALESEEDQIEAARRVADEGINVRETTRMIKDIGARRKRETRKKTPADPQVKALINRLSDRFGTKVDIRTRGKGGRILIEYYSDAELNGLLDQLLDSDQI